MSVGDIDRWVEQAIAEGDRWQMEQIMEEFCPFLRFLLSRPTLLHNVLEIGVRRGGTLAVWHTLATGTIVGVDLPTEFNWSRHKLLAAAYPRFESVLSDSHTESALRAVVRCLNHEPVDLLFIDGDHSLAGVTRDFELYRPLVRAGGLVVFHDIVDSQFMRDTDTRVCEFWDKLAGEKVEFNTHGEWGGLGVLTV